MSDQKEFNNQDIGNSRASGGSRWNQMRRLEFIDFRLGCDGRINRGDLVEFFRISIPQASLDFARYHQMVLESDTPRRNLVYDRHLKVYIRTDDFKPLFPTICAPANYLSDLLAYAQGELNQSRNFFGFIPPVVVATFNPPHRNIDASVLYHLIEAIRSHKAVHITYLSMKHIKPCDYLVAPHSFAFDGMRWHVRAYCYDRHEFRDYVLSRVIKCAEPKISAPNDRFPDPIGNGFREVGTTGRDDAQWNELVDLVLKANPELPEPARRVIEHDYGMSENGSVVYTCRRALLFYALQWLRLTQEDSCLPAEQRQLVLDNEAEIFRRLAGGH